MESSKASKACKSCSSRALETDFETGNMVCSECGVVQDYDNFQADIGGINGPTGTYVQVGQSGTGNNYSYNQTKIYEAKKEIESVMLRLGLDSRSNEVKTMIDKITEGEYGTGKWFPVFIGACAYVVMRKANKTIPITEVSDSIGCDIHELGRMITRVTDFLEIKLPEFDIVNSLERAINTCPSFHKLEEGIIGKIKKQGVFLVQCLVKWYLTTGRRPIPIVTAVLFFVAGLNKVDMKIEDLANELHVVVDTCKKRYKELLTKLVEVGQVVLPWGKDVTVKNILQHAHFVIKYMEQKSMEKKVDKNSIVNRGFDLDGVIDQCFENDFTYGFNLDKYSSNSSVDKVNNELEFSQESLTILYSKMCDEASIVKSTFMGGENYVRKRKRGFNFMACTDYWKGKSELSKKLMLKKILEIDVGLNATPPSFDKGCLVYEKRREKINAAKLRIRKTMSNSGNSELCVTEEKRKRKRKLQVEIDWEDLIIETLLLHQVKEDEIEKGHYNALLDLHVFNDI